MIESRKLPSSWWGFRFSGILFLLLSLPLSALAELGGDVTTVKTDKVHMQGALGISQSPVYAVQEIQAAPGIVVRESVSPAGKVFAVAWQGPWPPDLRQVLGGYFDQYVQATRQASR